MVLFDDKEVEASVTVDEAREALLDIRKEYPSVFRWFFLWQVHKNREKNDSLCNQAASREAGGTTG